MELRADFSRREVDYAVDAVWKPSPLPGVHRRMLDRIGDEVARATSIVRYDPNSRFDPHNHPLGEEYLVLDGVFSDEDGDHGPGTYVRNPPGSRHTPRSEPGCTIFVKLRQFDPTDLTPVHIDTRTATFEPRRSDGETVLPLHKFGTEAVRLVRWAAGANPAPIDCPDGAELLVLSGDLADDHGRYPTLTWLRLPKGTLFAPKLSGEVLIYIRTGHLDRETRS